MTGRAELMAAQDAVLIAISDGLTIPVDRLRSLPPWRAVLLARVASRAGALSEAAVNRLVAEASRVGGNGALSPEKI